MKKYYTARETSELLGLTEQVVRNYMSLGKIKSEKKYNSVVISEQEIERQLELRKEGR